MEEEEILVVSREDLKDSFWSTEDAGRYLEFLENNPQDWDKYLRIFIYDPKMGFNVPSDVIKRLLHIHREGTLKMIDKIEIKENIRNYLASGSYY